ncbi:MAG: hypothetical protein K5754_14510 [Butyrivibrio sp.]|jgi:hypothetical protein|nr:hypothetical protein [Butyrivibrio sp.]
MGRIVLSDVAVNGVQRAKSFKDKNSPSYNKLVKEAEERIERDRILYASACKRANVYLAQ